MASKYGIGSGVNWTDDTSWSTTDGGTNDTTKPVAGDDVFLTANSGNMVITTGAVGRSLNCTGYTGNLSGSATLTLGDGTAGASNIALKLVSGMTFSATSMIAFASSSTTQQTITSAGKSINIFQTPNFSTAPNLLLTDALTCTNNIDQKGGTIDTGGFAVSATKWINAGGNARTVTITNSTVTLTSSASGTIWDATNATVNASGSTIVISNTSSSQRNFLGFGKTYGALTYTVNGSTGMLAMNGNNTFSAINFSDSSNARTIQFAAGSTITITSAAGHNINGTIGKLMTIQSDTGGSAYNLSVSSGVVTADYVSIKDSHAAGGATFNATNSTNVSGNTGWNFGSIGDRDTIKNQPAIALLQGLSTNSADRFKSDQNVRRYGTNRKSEIQGKIGNTGVSWEKLYNDDIT